MDPCLVSHLSFGIFTHSLRAQMLAFSDHKNNFPLTMYGSYTQIDTIFFCPNP